MPSVTIRNVPDRVLEQLRAVAKANHRSLQGEILHQLEYLAIGPKPAEYRPTTLVVKRGRR